MRFRSQSTGPVGVDITGRTVRLLQVRHRSAGVEIAGGAMRDVAVSEMGDDNALRTCLGELVAAHKFSGRTAVTCLPTADVSIKSIRLPDMPEAELQSAADFEARERFAAMGDDCVIRAIPVGRVGSDSEPQQEVIVYAVRPEVIDARLDIISSAGFDVAALEPAPDAFFRPFERFLQRASDADSPNALIEVDDRGSQIVLTRGSEIVFVKDCEVGGALFDQAVADSMNMSLNQAAELRRKQWHRGDGDDISREVRDATAPLIQKLARELNLSLRYSSVTFRGHRPQVVVCGGRDASVMLAGQLGEELEMTVEPADPFRGVDGAEVLSGDTRRTDAPGWTRVLGLALKTPARPGARKVA